MKRKQFDMIEREVQAIKESLKTIDDMMAAEYIYTDEDPEKDAHIETIIENRVNARMLENNRLKQERLGDEETSILDHKGFRPNVKNRGKLEQPLNTKKPSITIQTSVHDSYDKPKYGHTPRRHPELEELKDVIDIYNNMTQLVDVIDKMDEINKKINNRPSFN